MDEHTSAGLPTSSEMMQFINAQELRIAIEDHVSAKGITHKNLVVYFKPFHGKYYNWIRRYNGSENGWTKKLVLCICIMGCALEWYSDQQEILKSMVEA